MSRALLQVRVKPRMTSRTCRRCPQAVRAELLAVSGRVSDRVVWAPARDLPHVIVATTVVAVLPVGVVRALRAADLILGQPDRRQRASTRIPWAGRRSCAVPAHEEDASNTTAGSRWTSFETVEVSAARCVLRDGGSPDRLTPGSSGLRFGTISTAWMRCPPTRCGRLNGGSEPQVTVSEAADGLWFRSLTWQPILVARVEDALDDLLGMSWSGRYMWA